MRSGLPLTQLVLFSDGFPDGDISWELLDGTGATVTSGVVTPAAASVSAIITLTGAQNTIEAGVVSSPRELQWSYAVAGVLRNGRHRYRLEIFLPFGVSEQGVRRKLGLEDEELDDDVVDLATAYQAFQELVGATALAAATGYTAQLACDAIEAMAALPLLPALQVSLASKESSGTNQYQRAKVDWDRLLAQLERYVQDGALAVDPTYDPSANYGAILVPAVRNDPIVGNDQTG
jgi:hypothetical protein